MLLMLGGMWFLQRNNDAMLKLGGMLSAALLGYVMPPQVLHRLVRRYRAKIQEALPDTVDLLGIVLGTGRAITRCFV